MNSNPSAAQQKFHDELREMRYNEYAGRGQLHHIFGSKWKLKRYNQFGARIKKAGEWMVILLTPETHEAIKEIGFEGERELFFKQRDDYMAYFGKDIPVPSELIEYYQSMGHKWG